ncbi:MULTISPECIES: hypothetical protein [unclassified Mesorhizobium]|uniref:hypothetical protein n=1 Tax=unclassified Mesorhizobium TaxID=325217 RepID=UPI001CD105E1|nr:MULTISPECIES: hypothetical protein [unclassified Mesorhizobium]MBZ9974177.1 hypothetical protein [Mesorhizobium sp. BR-1-1-10]
MGKKVKQKPKQRAKHADERPLDRERAREAEYYARKVGITRDEALSIILEAHMPKLVIARKDGAKGK